MVHIVQHMQGDKVGFYSLSLTTLADMTGEGRGWPAEEMAWEIAKFMMPLSDEAIAVGKVQFSEELATEWVVALSDGGLSLAEAYDLFGRRIKERNGYLEFAVIENAGLPDACTTERHLRNQLVWDVNSPQRCRVAPPELE